MCASCATSSLISYVPFDEDDAAVNINNDNLSGKQRTPCNHDSITQGFQPAAANIVFGESFEDKVVVAANHDVVANDYDNVLDYYDDDVAAVDDYDVAPVDDKGGCSAIALFAIGVFSSFNHAKKKQKRSRGGASTSSPKQGNPKINTPIADLSTSKSTIIKPYNHSVVETAKL